MRFLISLLLVVLTLSACESQDDASSSPDATDTTTTVPFRQDGTLAFLVDGDTITTAAIEIAETDSARVRGLMQRTALPERSGMLFVFQREELQSFWMANTPLSLDLFFVDADSQVVNVIKYTRPLSDASLPSEAPAQYVVEMPAGFADTYGIVEGTEVRWRRE